MASNRSGAPRPSQLGSRARQAERFYLLSIDLWRARSGPSSLGLATTLSDLAWANVALGDASRAGSLWRQPLAIRTAILGSSNRMVAQNYGYMAIGAFAAHRLGEAESLCQQAIGIYERSGEVPGETDQVLSSLASVRLQQGRTSEAIQVVNKAIRLEQKANHPSIRLLSGYFYSLALAENAAGRPVDAEAHFQRALSLLSHPPYATQALRCNLLRSYAQFLSRRGRKKQAKTIQRQTSQLAQLIRRDSFAEYLVDVSSFH